jgi:hypothetical protein
MPGRVAFEEARPLPSDKDAIVEYVIGPDGSRLTIGDLPAPETERWVARRKAEIIAAVRGGLISLETACSRYELTPAELSSWQRSFDQDGLRGLRMKQIQRYRPGYRSQSWG